MYESHLWPTVNLIAVCIHINTEFVVSECADVKHKVYQVINVKGLGR